MEISHKMKGYRSIYEQVYADPCITLYDIAESTGLSRNTVSKYLKEMYSNNIIVGPHLTVAPSQTYKEYVYLLNFENPLRVFERLSQVPHVIYNGVTFGDWNTLIVTDKLLDFSHVAGFQTTVYQGVKGYSYTPPVVTTTWNEGFASASALIAAFTPGHPDKSRRVSPFVPWNADEWKLFHAFKYDLRRKVTPTLRKIGVRYRTYVEWMKTVETYCTIHTGFFPKGLKKYITYCFLISSDYESAVHRVMGYFPVTSFITESGSLLSVFISSISPAVTRNIFCTFYDMTTKTMIKGFKKAAALCYYRH